MPKAPKRYQTTIAVRPLDIPDFESLLQLLYRGKKNLDLPEHAMKFLKNLREKGEKGRFARQDWDKYCRENNLSKTTYYTMINKLIGVGLIEPAEHDFYKLSNRSERFFSTIAMSVSAFMAKKSQYRPADKAE